MADPLGPIPNSIDQLSELIESYRDIDTCNRAINVLSRQLLDQIREHKPTSLQLLARLNVVICPKTRGKFTPLVSGEKPRAIEELEKLSTSILHHSNECHLLESVTKDFYSGSLKCKEDVLLIEYMIENAAVESALYRNPREFIQHVSLETADTALGLLLRKEPNFFMEHVDLMIRKLTELSVVDLDARPNHTKFLLALSEASKEIKRQIEIRYPDIWEQYDRFEVERRSGQMWKCTGRVPEGEGYLYHFRIEDDYKDFTSEFSPARDKQREIFPAVEYHPGEVEDCFNKKRFTHGINDMKELLLEENCQEYNEICEKTIPRYELAIAQINFLEKLRFSVGEDFKTITFPNRELLINRYNELRKTDEYRDLPPLDIVSGAGIASDLEFIRLNMVHDGIISDGKEFVHDFFEHIIPLLKRANFCRSKFDEIKGEMIAAYQLYLDKIDRAKEVLGKYLPIFETLLGAYVDSLTSAMDGTQKVKETDISFKKILEHYFWEKHLQNRYSDSEKGPIFDKVRVLELLPLVE